MQFFPTSSLLGSNRIVLSTLFSDAINLRSWSRVNRQNTSIPLLDLRFSRPSIVTVEYRTKSEWKNIDVSGKLEESESETSTNFIASPARLRYQK
jgi:hypothetical protein